MHCRRAALLMDLRHCAATSQDGKSTGKQLRLWSQVTAKPLTLLLASATYEPDSIAGWRAGDRHSLSHRGALGRVDLQFAGCRRFRQSRPKNLLCPLRIPDHHAVDEGVWKKLNHPAAQVLSAAGLPDPARGARFHVAGICHLLARAALVSDCRRRAVRGEHGLHSPMVYRPPVVDQRTGAVLFPLALPDKEIAPAPRADAA